MILYINGDPRNSLIFIVTARLVIIDGNQNGIPTSSGVFRIFQWGGLEN